MIIWIWIAIIVLAVLVVLFGITHTWGIICFIALLVLLAYALWEMFKGRVKVDNNGVTFDSKSPPIRTM